jgi:hypothetical protein
VLLLGDEYDYGEAMKIDKPAWKRGMIRRAILLAHPEER